jgi:predicted transcriptional regulator with HTH domain
MPRISKNKENKIIEQILYLLYQKFPKQIFTSEIAQEIARDEEYIKKILLDMEKKELVIKILKNSEGINYLKRIRWRISNKAYDIYKKYNNIQ